MGRGLKFWTVMMLTAAALVAVYCFAVLGPETARREAAATAAAGEPRN